MLHKSNKTTLSHASFLCHKTVTTSEVVPVKKHLEKTVSLKLMYGNSSARCFNYLSCCWTATSGNILSHAPSAQD